MYKYVVKRLLLMIPVLLCTVFLVFAIMSLTPGDPGTLILGMTAKQEDIDRLNHEFGYDKPFLTRFVDYVKNIILHLDFGNSYRTRSPVLNEIAARFPATFKLAVSSMILSSLIGIPLGIMSAVRQYSFVDNLFTMVAMFFAAVPGFWLGLMLMLLFSLHLEWLPSSGIGSWKHFALPTLTLATGGAAGLLRLTRSTMLETVRQDYIRTARSKGASERTVIWNHALKNALLPVVTSLGMSFGSALGGAIVTETVFAMPGLGTLIVNSIRQKDIPVVLGSTVLLATLFCVIMLTVDIAYAFLDPRIKARYSKVL